GLLAGCRSTPATRQLGGGKASAEHKPELALDRREERLAQAHAHYAAGVLHDLNEETQAALQEYYLAAFSDPENERLVLEVSRRFLQNKQPEKAVEILKRA